MTVNTKSVPAIVRIYKQYRVGINTVASLILGLCIWEVVAYFASPLVMAPLEDIWAAGVDHVSSGRLWRDFSASGQGLIIGFVLAAVVGILIGLIMAVSRTIFDFLDPWVSALYSTPLIALAPVFIIIFGLGIETKIAVAFSLGVFPVIMNTTAGIRTTDQDLIATGTSFGAKRIAIFTKIMLPWAVPFILTGLRLAVGRALIGVVVAEFFGSRAGLGNMIFISAQIFDTASVWLGVFVLAVIGTVLIRLMYFLERRIAPWRSQ